MVMRTCRFCGIEVEHALLKGHATACRANPNYEKRIEKISLKLTKPRLTKMVMCEHIACGKEFALTGTAHYFENRKRRRFCSRTCANSHMCSDAQRELVSKKLRIPFEDLTTDQEYVYMVVSVDSWNQLMKRLKLPQTNSARKYVEQRVQTLDINIEHFRLNRGKRIEEVLCYRPNEKIGNVKKFLLKTGRLYECEVCSAKPIWQDKSLTLQLDHKNGDRFDHRPENLRFLCPNCHSQTPTFSWKNVHRKKKLLKDET